MFKAKLGGCFGVMDLHKIRTKNRYRYMYFIFTPNILRLLKVYAVSHLQRAIRSIPHLCTLAKNEDLVGEQYLFRARHGKLEHWE